MLVKKELSLMLKVSNASNDIIDTLKRPNPYEIEIIFEIFSFKIVGI